MGRKLGRLSVAVLILVVGAAAGCSTRHDPDFNVYAPPRSGRTVLEAADAMMNAAGQALDNLDARMENLVY